MKIKMYMIMEISAGFLIGKAEHCRRFLEMALGFPIEYVEISREKSIVYHPEYKGVRLDVYAEDEHHTRYNVEMQVAKKPALGKRARYYHGQIDMELPDVYVIFICDFDPFGKKKYRYTFTRKCEEDTEIFLDEGCRSIFLSTAGENVDEVSEELVKFLNFVRADLSESESNYEDDFVEKLQNSIRRIKSNREMEERFMIFEEMLRDEHAEGKAEGKIEDILELLEELGVIPEELRNRIASEKDLEVLKKWHKIAAKSDSLEKFLECM